MAIAKKIKQFFYSLSATDKYSDFDSRKSFNRINKPGVQTSLLGASNANDSSVSLTKVVAGVEKEGIHETRLAWRHIKKWLHSHSEDLNNSLSAPCTDSDINELEKDLSCTFPACVREFFRLTDGQNTYNDNGACGLFYGLRLLPIDEVAVMTESWRKVHVALASTRIEERGSGRVERDESLGSRLKPIDELGAGLGSGLEKSSDLGSKSPNLAQKSPKTAEKQTRFDQNSPKIDQNSSMDLNTFPGDSPGGDLSVVAGFKQRKEQKSRFPEQNCVPPKTILPIYAHSMWIPMITDGAGNFIGIDLSPDTPEAKDIPNAKYGQVILFGRDFDTKFRVADTFGDFLLLFANDLEKGNWDLRSSSDDEDMISGVDTELVYVDHTTKKETPYLDVLKDRVIELWVQAMDSETAESPEIKTLLVQLAQRYSYRVPNWANNIDTLISDNLNKFEIGVPEVSPKEDSSKTRTS